LQLFSLRHALGYWPKSDFALSGIENWFDAGRRAPNAALFTSIQQRFGVPPGPLLAIWGMETGFGSSRGNQNVLSAVATLAYDCRRTAYFTDQLYAALTLVERGIFSAGTRGSMHGEVGHTQFLPKNILNYGIGGSLDIAANALSSTANFLKAHGWRAGAGYQPGEANFAALQAPCTESGDYRIGPVAERVGNAVT
jgi:membrane-bound lytic murein transglycosylase B